MRRRRSLALRLAALPPDVRRERACSQINGAVHELAFGTGRNLPYYPEGLRLTGVELSPQMLPIGKKRAEELGRDIDLRIGDAQALEFQDHSFDTVIITFGLCTIPDDRAAAAMSDVVT